MGVIGEEVIDIDGDNNAATTASCSEVDKLLLDVSVEGDDRCGWRNGGERGRVRVRMGKVREWNYSTQVIWSF